MADIVVRCGACQARFRVDEKFAGKRAKCPKCQAIAEVPALAAGDAAAPLAAAPTAAVAPAAPSSTGLPAFSVSKPAAPAPFVPAAPASALKTAAPLAAAETVADAVVTPEAPVSDFGFQLKNTPSSAPVARGGGQAPASTHAPSLAKKQGPPIALIAGGGVLLGLLALGGGFVLLGGLGGGGGKGNTASVNKPKKSAAAEIVLDWPASERKQAELLVNDKKEALLPAGEVKISLKPGKHTLTIKRRGYAPIDAEFDLSPGEVKNYKPDWKPADSIAQATPAASASGAGSASKSPPATGGSSFPLGTAVPDEEAPDGFDGFRQNMTAAQRDALAQRRNLVVVFGSSDSDEETQQLAESFAKEPVKSRLSTEFIAVVLDFPRTGEGQSKLFDSAQNIALAQEYRVTHIPTLVLLDPNGRPYYRQSEFSAGFANVAAYLDEGRTTLAERDQKLLAAETGDLSKAAEANAWILKNRFLAAYANEIGGWNRKAQATDPDNAQGLLENFFESTLRLEMEQVNKPDAISLNRITGLMAKWLGKKFKDPDRGVRVNMAVMAMAAAAEVPKAIDAHLAEARSYVPNDPDLKNKLAELETRLRNRNIKGTGTGWLVAPGYVFTNHHVVKGANNVAMRLPGQKDPLPAKVVAFDAQRDAALLKVEFPAGFSAAPLAVSREIPGRGAQVAAFGFPLGDSIGGGLKFTAGAVSALPDDAAERMLLLDLRVNPGNSGGPLCNMQGQVVGMITAKTNGVFNESYGMAIPTDDLHKFLDKHLPPDSPRAAAPAGEALGGWDKVDQIVSPAVFMILALE